MKALLDYVENIMIFPKEIKEKFTKTLLTEFFNKMLEVHSYITTSNLTGDFLTHVVHVNVYYGAGKKYKRLRSILSKTFRPMITKALREGKIIKDGRQRFKIIKKR